MNMRPSLLPKLAACPRYVAPEYAGKAAARGTALDVAFRSFIASEQVPSDWHERTADERAALSWAVDTAKVLAGGAVLEAGESHLRVQVMGMEGTADLLCSDRLWSADLKSGMERNYLEQQAAYALGFMDSHFADSWTVHLLFCDERKLVTHRFTRESATDLLVALMLHVRDDLATATPCEYCDWCALRWTCPQKLEAVAWFLRHDPASLDLTAYANDPHKVGPLLDMTHAIAKDGGVHDLLRAGALSSIMAGAEVPGWRQQKGRTTESVAAVHLAQLVAVLGPQRVLSSLPNVSGSKFAELWAEAKPDAPVPEGILQMNHGAAFLAKSKTQKAK